MIRLNFKQSKINFMQMHGEHFKIIQERRALVSSIEGKIIYLLDSTGNKHEARISGYALEYPIAFAINSDLKCEITWQLVKRLIDGTTDTVTL